MGQWRWHDDTNLTSLWGLWAEAAAGEGQTVFQRPELAQEWLHAFAGQARPRIRFSPQLGVIVPWVEWGARCTLLGAGLFDYCDAVGAPPPEDTGAELPAPPPAADFPGLREDSPWLAFWRRLAPDWRCPEQVAPRLMAPIGAEELDRRHPTAAERLRRVQRGGDWGRVCDPAARAALLEWLLRQKQARMQALGRANVLGGQEALWLRRMVARHPRLAELWRGEMEGKLAAGFLTWAAPRARYGYLLAFAPEFARHSPAILLLYHVLRESMREGLEMDFLTGDQSFKLRFADSQRRLFHPRWPAAAGREGLD